MFIAELVSLQARYDDVDTPLMALLAGILGAYFHGRDTELLDLVSPWIEQRLVELLEAAGELTKDEDELLM